MSVINKQSISTEKYRWRNGEYFPYKSLHTFKKRKKQIVADKSNSATVSSKNLNFKIVRQIKNSKPTKTIYKIGNKTYIFK